MNSLSNGLVKNVVHRGAEHGPLRGLTFVVKDMYEVCGHTNACGNPTWLSTHPAPAAAHAPCVQALLDAGATLLGVAHMDELAYSLNGQNYHFGTPVNRAAPDCVPGGSSSGSAVRIHPALGCL
jgi:amidase